MFRVFISLFNLLNVVSSKGNGMKFVCSSNSALLENLYQGKQMRYENLYKFNFLS